MLHPRALGRRISSIVRHRRPSAAMVVALLALFLAAGGASYAATSLPRNSVGTTQIQNEAVTNHKLAKEAVGWRKIIPGTIGSVRVNKNAVQLRVSGTCSGGTPAISTIQNNGRVTCSATNPATFSGGQSNPVAITSDSTVTPITGVSLAANSSYLVMANPQISVKTATGPVFGHVAVTCTLSVGGAPTATQQRTVTFDPGSGPSTPANNGAMAASQNQSETMPLMVSVASATTAQTAQVTCTRTLTGTRLGTPTVTAAGTITAIQTASNSTLASTVATAPAPPAPTPPATTTAS